DLCTPGLTTLGGSHEDTGRIAVELLLESSSMSLHPPAPRSVVLPSHLVIRSSTGEAPPAATKKGKRAQD
ncbi:MAG: LacI family transcriptional regulator, partial [Streptosporangiaceae bacterium]